jgi:hypothetical protein
MHLLNEVPEYEAKLKEGSVTVSTLSQVGSFLHQEKLQRNETYSKAEKIELLTQVEGKSSRQTAQILSGISPQSARPERTRVLSPEATEIRFTADADLMRKLDRLKELLAHRPRARSGIAGLIGELAEVALKKLDPLAKAPSRKAQEESGKKTGTDLKEREPHPDLRTKVAEMKTPERGPDSAAQTFAPAAPSTELAPQPTRHIPASVRREIWHRDQGQCQYRDPKTGRRCLSRYKIQIDHRIPFAKNGASDVGNCRLTCATHNAFLAIREFGARQARFADRQPS